MAKKKASARRGTSSPRPNAGTNGTVNARARAREKADEWKARWLKAYRETDCVSAACDITGKSTSTVYRHRDTDGECRDQWDEVTQRQRETLRGVMLHQAIHGREGRPVVAVQAHSLSSESDNGWNARVAIDRITRFGSGGRQEEECEEGAARRAHCTHQRSWSNAAVEDIVDALERGISGAPTMLPRLVDALRAIEDPGSLVQEAQGRPASSQLALLYALVATDDDPEWLARLLEIAARPDAWGTGGWLSGYVVAYGVFSRDQQVGLAEVLADHAESDLADDHNVYHALQGLELLEEQDDEFRASTLLWRIIVAARERARESGDWACHKVLAKGEVTVAAAVIAERFSRVDLDFKERADALERRDYISARERKRLGLPDSTDASAWQAWIEKTDWYRTVLETPLSEIRQTVEQINASRAEDVD